MKTAEEWIKLWGEIKDRNMTETQFDQRLLSEVKAIQLDAMKEGMRRAAQKTGEIAKLYDDMPSTCAALIKVPSAILASAEQLTEKDL